jgi:hypothetical protein
MSSIQFQPLLHLTFAEAEKFLASHGFTAFQTYAEPARLIVPETMKIVPNRAELELYCDANSEHRVYKADIYRDGKLLTTIEIDECGECGGICDGVHASQFAVYTLLDMTVEDAQKYCDYHKIKSFIVKMGSSAIKFEPGFLRSTRTRVELSVQPDKENVQRVCAVEYYKDGRLVDILKGNYLAPPQDTFTKEEKIMRLVLTLRKQPQHILEEAIRQVSAERVKAIVDVLKVQDPEILNEVINRLTK